MQDVKKVDAWITAPMDESVESVQSAARRAAKKIKRLVDQLGWDFQAVADDANKATESNEWTAEIVENAYRATKRKKSKPKTSTTKKGEEKKTDIPTEDSKEADDTEVTKPRENAQDKPKSKREPHKYTENEVDLSKGKQGIVYLRKDVMPPEIGETIIMPSGAAFVVRRISEDKPVVGSLRGYELSVERVTA